MTAIINGSSPTVTFSDGTTQASAGLPLTGGTLTGGLTLPSAGITFSDATTQSSGSGVAKAWVSVTTGNTITASYNVSSVTLNSTGVMTINFTNAISSNYAVVQGYSSAEDSTQEGALGMDTNTYSTTQVKVFCQTRNTAITPSRWFIAIFR